MKQFNYKCVVSKNGNKMYYKRVNNKWKRISNKTGMKAERKNSYNMMSLSFNFFKNLNDIGEINFHNIEDDSERFKIDRNNYEEFGKIEVVDKNYKDRYLFDKNYGLYVLFDNNKSDVYYLDLDKKNLEILKKNIEKRENIKRQDFGELKKNIFMTRLRKENRSCYGGEKLKEIEEEIIRINEKLQKKCPELSVVFKNQYDMKGQLTTYLSGIFSSSRNDSLVLCLYYNNNCISSITFNYYRSSNSIEISSRTAGKYEGKKYNKLLRILTIIICRILICENTNIKYITSSPENWISAWLLIDNFEVKFKDEGLQKIINENENNRDNLKKAIEDYFSYHQEVEIKVEINDHNLKKANYLFDELLSSSDNKKNIKCPEMNI